MISTFVIGWKWIQLLFYFIYVECGLRAHPYIRRILRMSASLMWVRCPITWPFKFLSGSIVARPLIPIEIVETRLSCTKLLQVLNYYWMNLLNSASHFRNRIRHQNESHDQYRTAKNCWHYLDWCFPILSQQTHHDRKSLQNESIIIFFSLRWHF